MEEGIQEKGKNQEKDTKIKGETIELKDVQIQEDAIQDKEKKQEVIQNL